MARRIYSWVGLLLLLCALVMSPIASAAGDGCAKTLFGATATTCTSAMTWQYDRDSRSFVRPQIVDSQAVSGVRYEYSTNERCTAEGIDCGAAALPCPSLGGDPGRMYQSWRYELTSSGGRVGGSGVMRHVCIYRAINVPVAVVEAAVHAELRKRIPVPSVASSPPGHSLVNLFTIFSTVPAAEQAITFTTPVPGEVRAVPEYVWDFGDGLTGSGPGTPFDPEVLPSKNKGYYLGATYTKPGSKHVALTVTWRVTFRLEGITSVPLVPIVMTASEDKLVATAKAVLVR